MNPRRVLTRAQMLDHVWDYDFGGDASVLETYISYLRKKIDVEAPPLIHTVRGVGYTCGCQGAERAVSLRARLLIGLVVLTAAGLAVAGVVTYAAERSFLVSRVDQAFTRRDQQLRGLRRHPARAAEGPRAAVPAPAPPSAVGRAVAAGGGPGAPGSWPAGRDLRRSTSRPRHGVQADRAQRHQRLRRRTSRRRPAEASLAASDADHRRLRGRLGARVPRARRRSATPTRLLIIAVPLTTSRRP